MKRILFSNVMIYKFCDRRRRRVCFGLFECWWKSIISSVKYFKSKNKIDRNPMKMTKKCENIDFGDSNWLFLTGKEFLSGKILRFLSDQWFMWNNSSQLLTNVCCSSLFQQSVSVLTVYSIQIIRVPFVLWIVWVECINQLCR